MDNKHSVYSIISIACSFISSLLLFISAVKYGDGVRFFASAGMLLIGHQHLKRYKKEREDTE